MFPISDLPDEILISVLSWLPGNDIIKNCALVNKRWNELTKQQKLWHDKCVCVGFYNPKYSSFRPVDFKRYYFINPYTKNLIKNPCGEELLKYWNVDQNGGDGFQYETTPVGTNPVRLYNEEVKGDIGCWATSYSWCTKHQLIDLLQEGCDAEVLDKMKPDIEISEWYSARFDCGVTYWLQVYLLNEEKEKLTDRTFEFMDSKPPGCHWFHVCHTFKSYPSGLRYILYKHRGKDTQFWAGYYGAKMTLSTLKFNFKNL